MSYLISTYLPNSVWHQDLMVKDERRTVAGAGPAREALLDYLRREWPDSVDIVAKEVAPGASASDFFEACTSLQHDGLIMYEALILGVGPSPKLLAAALTRKGHEAALQR